MYKGEIIHFISGNTEFLGEIDQGVHPNGENWLRIKNPCLIAYNPEKQGVMIAKMGGIDDVYRPFVDIRIPSNAVMQIRVLDKASELYKTYHRQIEQMKPKNIVLPGAQDPVIASH
jgi:hypothetical protein